MIAVLVTNPLTFGILFSTSPIFVLKDVLVANRLESDILLSTFYFSSKSCLSLLYFDFLRTSLLTASLNFFKSIGKDFSLPTSKLST